MHEFIKKNIEKYKKLDKFPKTLTNTEKANLKAFKKLKKKKRKSTQSSGKDKWFISKVGSKVRMSPTERLVNKVLIDLKIQFKREVSFKDLNPTNSENGFLRFDFFIPTRNIAIEYDGKDFHKNESVQKRDELKNQYCKKNNIRLIRLNSEDLKDLKNILISLLK